MQTLLDTNVLLRSIQPSSPDRSVALAAVAALLKSGRTLTISSQTIYEFLAVATRSVADSVTRYFFTIRPPCLNGHSIGKIAPFDPSNHAGRNTRLFLLFWGHNVD